MQQLLWKSLTTRANFRLSANLSNFMKRLKFSSGLVSSSNGRKGAIPSIGDDINDKAYLLSNVLTEGFLRVAGKWGCQLNPTSITKTSLEKPFIVRNIIHFKLKRALNTPKTCGTISFRGFDLTRSH